MNCSTQQAAITGWLDGYLTALGGRAPVQQVRRAAASAQIPYRKLDEARRQLDITTINAGGTSCWQHPRVWDDWA